MNGVQPAVVERQSVGAPPSCLLYPQSAKLEGDDMGDLIVINDHATDGNAFDVQGAGTEKNLPTGRIPRFALEGAGRLTLYAQGQYTGASVTSTLTAKLYTTPDNLTAGTLRWTSAGLSCVSAVGTIGFFDWFLEIVPMPQIDGSYVQWLHSILRVKPDGTAAVVKLEEDAPLALDVSNGLNFYTSLTNGNAAPLARMAGMHARIRGARSGS